MSEETVDQVISGILSSLKPNLGEHLISVYQFGSLSCGFFVPAESDINLMVITSDEITIGDFRKAILPDWFSHASLLGRVPLFTNRSMLSRHLRLNPILAAHLVECGKLLSGESLSFEIPSLDEKDVLARSAHQAMLASAALTPALLPEKEGRLSLRSLRRLCRQLSGKAMSSTENAADLFAHVQQQISRQLEQHPELIWPDHEVENPPPLVGGLRAIYEVDNRLILLLPDWPADQLANNILSISWDKVADRVTGQFRSLWVTTPTQLRLILSIEKAADLYLNNYRHAWGVDPLGDLSVSQWKVYRDMGRLPSTIQVAKLPQAYVTTSEQDLSVLVHDYQNTLLNLQLRSELLSRAARRPIVKPPEPLPDKETSMEVRIQAIHQSLGWWADHYTTAMESAMVPG